MAVLSLNRLRRLRLILTGQRKRWLRWRHGVEIDDSASISLTSTFRAHRPGIIRIGPQSLVAFKTLLITHSQDGREGPITVGRRCFIGGGAVIMPGVTIGDESIVGSGAVVFDDVPPRSIIGGNPARVLRSDIEVGPFGRLKGAELNQRKFYK